MSKVVAPAISKEDVDAIGAKLDALLEKPKKMSAREAVEILKPKIKALRQRGYSFDEITAELVKNGIKTTVSTVKSAASVKRTAKRTAEVKRGQAVQSAPQTAPIQNPLET